MAYRATDELQNTVNLDTATKELGYIKNSDLTGAISNVTTTNLTSNRAVISNADGKVASSTTTDTELGYLSGANSNIQQQITAALIAAYSTRALTTAEIDEILAQ